MAYPPVDVVSDTDEVLGTAMLAECWEKGLRHRVVYCMVHDGTGRWLLQKRSAEMLLYPNCWDVSAGGHVDTGMTYEEAIQRELEEELGLKDAAVTEVFHGSWDGSYTDGRKANRFYRVYIAQINPEDVRIDEHELSDSAWFDASAIEQLMHEDILVANGLVLVWPHIHDVLHT
jgi:isopentenyldiphosphate isomerase